MISTLFCLSFAACGGASIEDGALNNTATSPHLVLAAAAQPKEAVPSPSANAVPSKTRLEIAGSDLEEMNRPFGSPHDALPAGVPLGYDWARFSRRGAGNTIPPNYRAFTGWGHAHWIAGAAPNSQALEIRANQTYLCTVTNGARQWSRVQQGAIEGAAFLPDLAGNKNILIDITNVEPGHTRARLPAGRIFHYWPKTGRVAIGSDALCGILVAFQARAVAPDGGPLPANTAPALLIGAGADFWIDTTTPWDNYKTNIDAGIGQLRRLTTQWRWYGMGTAAPADVRRLQLEGFVDRTHN